MPKSCSFSQLQAVASAQAGISDWTSRTVTQRCELLILITEVTVLSSSPPKSPSTPAFRRSLKLGPAPGSFPR